MALTTCKDCKRAVSTSAKACPNCGAPIKSRGTISSIARWFVILFLIIPVGIAIFIAVNRTQVADEFAPQVVAETRAQESRYFAKACSVSDIEIKSIRARFVDECSTAPCIYLKGVAVLTNKCADPIGVQIKITGYNASREPMATNELWPASVGNIPPGDYTFSIDQWLDYEPGMKSVELQPNSVHTFN